MERPSRVRAAIQPSFLPPVAPAWIRDVMPPRLLAIPSTPRAPPSARLRARKTCPTTSTHAPAHPHCTRGPLLRANPKARLRAVNRPAPCGELARVRAVSSASKQPLTATRSAPARGPQPALQPHLLVTSQGSQPHNRPAGSESHREPSAAAHRRTRTSRRNARRTRDLTPAQDESAPDAATCSRARDDSRAFDSREFD